MTSSFTNLVLASSALGMLSQPEAYESLVQKLAGIARHFLLRDGERLASAARKPFRSALFLGTGCRYGAAREASLKMVEMTGGSVDTSSESFLGLRHGPMSGVHPDTLVVCFLSSDRLIRAYEADLIEELNHKQLGLAKVIVGESIPRGLVLEDDVAFECPGLASVGDEHAPVIDVLVGQLLALFRSLFLGVRPDAPSPKGIISRVVEGFEIHR